MRNPFITNGYAGPDYFCDRVEETQNITEALVNENNLALISPRRLGKTELIHHVFAQHAIQESHHTFMVDIYSTSNLRDFVNVFGKAVLDELRPKGRAVWEGFLTFVSSLRSEISFDINGSPSWSVGLGKIANPSVTLDEIFGYLNHAEKPCLIAIDEFQQITRYPDADSIEATLRTYVQRCTNAHFIFSGSHRHLMDGMFTSPSRPFYQAVTLMNLAPLPLDKYTSFAQEKFQESGKQLDSEVVSILYSRFDAVTSYMHRILNVLFSRTEKGDVCKTEMVDEAIDYILRLSSDTYESLLYQMPDKQRQLFLAIAHEGKATNVMSSSFVKKHNLPSASSVSSALKGLLEKDFITHDRGIYAAYDQFFVLWLKHKGFIS